MTQIGKIDSCSFVVNGQEAINKIRQEVEDALTEASLLNLETLGVKKIRPVALALLDLQMPLKNGF